MQHYALVIGAGPAGLTAANELLDKTDLIPIILEQGDSIGGISRTVNYKGNRIDIGGHRFFSKSETIMEYWKRIFPLQDAPAAGEPASRTPGGHDPEKIDQVFLIRNRVSRIYYRRSFFNYPIALSWKMVRSLGPARLFRIFCSYCRAAVLPCRNEASLEDFMINRFGRELYRTFFMDYTEKVWGVKCKDIPAEWGAQRIKGLSIGMTLWHCVSRLVRGRNTLEQKQVETSLIEKFLYPKYGPGQLWESLAARIRERGGLLRLGHKVEGLQIENHRVVKVRARSLASNEVTEYSPDVVFSSMPVKELIQCIGGERPGEAVREIAGGLCYRDFITVGLLLEEMKLKNHSKVGAPVGIIPDNWIYIQEPDVRVGRLQVYNNWSPYMVADRGKVWVGLEYFCREGDDLWSKSDAALAAHAIGEMVKLGFIDTDKVKDHVVIRVPKAYPAYFGSYNRFGELRAYLDTIGNLYPIGRNGMHRYNNQDHSMMTAIIAVENIVKNIRERDNIWDVNMEQDYHEAKGC